MFRQPQEHPDKTNTALHQALVHHDQQLALQLAAADTNDINAKSLGNSALMLALKKGNFEVAKVILQRKDVRVVPYFGHAVDNHGLSPLHLALAFRENEIVRLILQKYAEYIVQLEFRKEDLPDFLKPDSQHADALHFELKLQSKLWPGVLKTQERAFLARSLYDMYTQDFDEAALRKMITDKKYDQGVVEKPSLVLLSAPELTDALLFHSRSICLNNALLPAEAFKQEGTPIYANSQLRYADDLMTGLHAIVDYRNKKPLDPELVAMLRAEPAPEPEPSQRAHL